VHRQTANLSIARPSTLLVSDRAKNNPSMTSIGALGPVGTYSWQAVNHYNPAAEIVLFETIPKIFDAFEANSIDQAIVPLYNTIDKGIPETLHCLKLMPDDKWIVDNLILPIQHSLGTLDQEHDITLLISKDTVLRQCERYIAQHYPNIALKALSSTAQGIQVIQDEQLRHAAVIASKEAIITQGLIVRDENLVKNNRTRFAVLGRNIPKSSGYDGTIIVTTPLRDRVGLLHDILEEFESRNINLLDLRSDTDVETQRLFFYIEMEGHIRELHLNAAIERIRSIIDDPDSVKVLGSFPRVDMRQHKIKRVGFIGTGPMSIWFQERLAREGIETYLTGRTSKLRPEQMITQVDVVIPCIPISAGAQILQQYAKLLQPGQALILLTGETTKTLSKALQYSDPGVEVMAVHNLWGPNVSNMKNKNAIVIKTDRSGELCQEFENFLYKHGARITQDPPEKHNLMMGIEQKLPTAVSIAFANILRRYQITPADLQAHATLTSIYFILSISRLHAQSPKTYAEILASNVEGTGILTDFLQELEIVKTLGEKGERQELEEMVLQNTRYLGHQFLNRYFSLTQNIDTLLSAHSDGQP
jgi:prephenate dehydratase/prephenate dehydrogenase